MVSRTWPVGGRPPFYSVIWSAGSRVSARRPSTACQITKTGTPTAISRARLSSETASPKSAPTPTIGGVGLIDDFTRSVTIAFKRKGEAILLIGATEGWLGQSLYLREICGREAGAPPPVDLATEKKNGEFVRTLIAEQVATAVHDVSDGGVLVALAEMALASKIGATLASPAGVATHAYWFGEDQARYIVTVDESKVAAINANASKNGVSLLRLGATGGDALTLPGERPILIAALNERFEGWLPRYMAGGAA